MVRSLKNTQNPVNTWLKYGHSIPTIFSDPQPHAIHFMKNPLARTKCSTRPKIVCISGGSLDLSQKSPRGACGIFAGWLTCLWLVVFALFGHRPMFADVRSINGTINFDANSDGAFEATLNSTGFGLGTTTPSTNLHVTGNAIVSGTMVVGGTSNASGSNLHICGTVATSVQTVTGNTTLTNHSVVLADTSAGNIWLYLPSPASASGRTYWIKKMSNSHALYLNGGPGLIEGVGQLTLNNSSTGGYPYMQVISSGNTWYVLATSPSGGGNSLWTPASINTQAWYDAAETGTITSSAGNISKWADKSGKGFDLEAVGADVGRPTTGTNAIGGHNVVDFSTASKTLSTTSNPFSTAITDAAVFIVANVKDFAGQNPIISLTGASWAENRWIVHCPINNAGRNIKLGCGSITEGNERVILSSTSLVANQQLLLGAYCSVSDNVQKIWQNGNEVASDNTGHSVELATWESQHIVLAGITRNFNIDKCHIGECIIINGIVSQTTREKIEGYLAHKWGLAANLPGGHPYKSAPPVN